MGLLFFNRISSLTITVSVTFWQILKRIHIPVKEVQLKLIQREDFFIDTSFRENNKNENEFLTRISGIYNICLMRNVDIFSSFESTRGASHKFLTLSSGFYHGNWSGRSPKTFYFELCTKSWQVRGCVSEGNSWDFLILFDEHCLNLEKFIISE